MQQNNYHKNKITNQSQVEVETPNKNSSLISLRNQEHSKNQDKMDKKDKN